MPQDQDDIKGAGAMKQAPTPGPLSGDDCYDEHQPGCDCVISEQTAAPMPSYLERLAPTAPVEASGSEREAISAFVLEAVLAASVDIPPTFVERTQMRAEIARNTTDAILAALRPQPSGETREAVARIIDPKGWKARDGQYRGIKGSTMHDRDRPLAFANADYYTRESLTKADAILALIRSAPVASGGQHSSGEVAFLGHLIAPKSGVGAVFVPKGEPVPLMHGRGSVTPVYSGPQNVTAPVAETAGEAVGWRWRQRKRDTQAGHEIVHSGSKPSTWINAEDVFDLTPLYASPAPASPLPEGGGPTCQVCGSKIEAWTCQGCGAQFQENDAGSLVLGIPAAPTGDRP